MIVEYYEYAHDFIKNLVADPDAVAYGMFELYGKVDVTKYPALRDRTEEISGAVAGMAGLMAVGDVKMVDVTGSQLYKQYGAGDFIVGAMFAKTYRIIWA